MGSERRAESSVLDTDVLVLGAGAAGLRAAAAAADVGARVLLACKGAYLHHGSSFARLAPGWGIQAAWDSTLPGDTREAHFEETLEAGSGLADPGLVEVLVSRAPERLRDLMSWGVRFRRRVEGDFLRIKGCFGKYPRAFVLESIDSYVRAMSERLKRRGVGLVQDFRAVRLEIKDGVCVGATGLQGDGVLRIRSGALVLAAGGFAGLYPMSLCDPGLCGDALSLGTDVGARTIHTEFVQFMLGTVSGGTKSFLLPERLSVQKALKDAQGRNLWNEFFESEEQAEEAIRLRGTHFPFSCRDVSGVIDAAVSLGGAGRPGVELTDGDERVPVIPLSHACNGGLAVDVRGETSVPNLFAAGEAAGGMHGADRLGGNMMTSTQVFGAVAGESAARRSMKSATRASLPSVEERLLGPKSDEAFPDGLMEALAEGIGSIAVVREGMELRKTMERTKRLMSELDDLWSHGRLTSSTYFDRRHRIRTLNRVAEAALARPVSIGGHFRLDHPPDHWPSKSVTALRFLRRTGTVEFASAAGRRSDSAGPVKQNVREGTAGVQRG